MVDRIQNLNSQFNNGSGSNYNGGKVGAKRADDVCIIGMARTACTKAKKGAQRNTPLEAMLKVVLADAIKKAKVPAAQIDEVIIGNVLAPGSAAAQVRMAMFMAGIPETTSCHAINRMCSSGLQSVATIANGIKAGDISIGIGGGMESMSHFNMQGGVDPNFIDDEVFECEGSSNCLMGMGITSENVAKEYGITRDQQDSMAVASNAKALAQEKARSSEITVYTTKTVDAEGEEKEVVVDRDDGARAGTTMESLGKLKPAFMKGGSTTAGNSSQMTDGAACVVLARRDIAEKLGCTILGRFIGFSVAGVPPQIMGVGPAFAIPEALKKSGLEIKDIDIFEVNEAFASQATYCTEMLKIPSEKLNRRGGAIALGHPLGMTGARMINTLYSQMNETNSRYGIVSMCIGTGMGAAGVFEREA